MKLSDCFIFLVWMTWHQVNAQSCNIDFVPPEFVCSGLVMQRRRHDRLGQRKECVCLKTCRPVRMTCLSDGSRKYWAYPRGVCNLNTTSFTDMHLITLKDYNLRVSYSPEFGQFTFSCKNGYRPQQKSLLISTCVNGTLTNTPTCGSDVSTMAMFFLKILLILVVVALSWLITKVYIRVCSIPCYPQNCANNIVLNFRSFCKSRRKPEKCVPESTLISTTV